MYFEHDYSKFAINDADGRIISQALKQYRLKLITNVGLISIVGFGLNYQSSLIFEVINIVNKCSLKIIVVSTSSTKISCIVQGSKIETAQQALYEKLCL